MTDKKTRLKPSRETTEDLSLRAQLLRLHQDHKGRPRIQGLTSFERTRSRRITAQAVGTSYGDRGAIHLEPPVAAAVCKTSSAPVRAVQDMHPDDGNKIGRSATACPVRRGPSGNLFGEKQGDVQQN